METKRDDRLLKLSEAGNLEMLPLAKDASNADAPRSFRMMAYSGAPVRRYFGLMAIDLAGIAFDSGRTPILKNHDPGQIVGMSEKVERTGAGLVIEGRVSRKTQAALEVANLADEGFLWQASVGLEIESVERVEPGAEVQVNGRKLSGPAYVVRRSKLRESSFVPVGADGDTSGVVLSLFEEQKGNVMPEGEKKTDAEAARQEALKGERQRIADLKAAFPKDQAFALEAIEKGQSVQEAKAAYADKLAADLEAKTKEIETLKKGSGKPSGQALGAQPVEFGAGAGGDSGGKSFMELADEYAAKHACSMGKALSETARLHPEKHQAYVEECRKAPARKVERIASK